MRVRYLATAVRDLEAIFELIHDNSPVAAADVLHQIRAFVDLAATVEDLGRLVGRGNIRMTAVPRLPYVVYYRRLPGEMRILRVRHGKRRALRRP